MIGSDNTVVGATRSPHSTQGNPTTNALLQHNTPDSNTSRIVGHVTSAINSQMSAVQGVNESIYGDG